MVGAVACISGLGVIVVEATGTTWLQIFELSLSITVVAFLFRRDRHSLLMFVTAAVVIVVNQILLAHGYLTFLNAGQVMSASAFGPLAGSIITAIPVASITAAGFYFRRPWAYVTVIALLIGLTWPTALSELSI